MTEECRINSGNVALLTRFKTLIGDVNFEINYDQVLDSPERLLAIGEHNLQEYEKIEAMPEERQERIEELVWNILASAIQNEAIAKCGNSDRDSIRQALYDRYYQPENKAYGDRVKRLAEQYLVDCGFTEAQLRIINDCLDALPLFILDTMVQGMSQLRLLPRTEAQSIASVLADMMKEAGDANSVRDSRL